MDFTISLLSIVEEMHKNAKKVNFYGDGCNSDISIFENSIALSGPNKVEFMYNSSTNSTCVIKFFTNSTRLFII